MQTLLGSSHSQLPVWNRRTFMQTSGGLLGALLAHPLAPLLQAADAKDKALVGSNQYGWGQYYERDHKKLDLGEVMSALRDAGYDYLEGNLDSGNPDNNLRLAEQMKAKGLQPVTLYTGARLHESAAAKESVARILAAAKVCRAAGFQALSCNIDPIGRDKTDSELENQAAALKDLAQGLREIGLRLGIHHHLPEMANHAREFHYMFQHTDASLVGFCYDVHWVFKGGLKPAEVLPLYGNRVVSWHLRQSRNGPWWETLDDGDVDYAEVAQYARQHSLSKLYTVELALETGTKVTRSVVENHRISREYVRKIFGA